MRSDVGDSGEFLPAVEIGQALLVSDFGPKTAMKIVDNLRKDILAGRLKSGPQIKVSQLSITFIFESLRIILGAVVTFTLVHRKYFQVKFLDF